MPGDEVGDRIHKLYELENSSEGQHQSQAVDSHWPVHNYNQWVGKQILTGAALSSNLKNCNAQQIDFVKGHGDESLNVFLNQNYTQLPPRADFSISFSKNQDLNSNGCMLGLQKFQARQSQSEFLGENAFYDPHNLTSKALPFLKSQRENASGDSPTLTTNSERSEITEASTDFDFVGGKHQLVRGQQPDTPQTHLMQQSGYNDMQLLQQHVMLKQLQELQRQQQLQNFGDLRQQNSSNQISAVTKQATEAQNSPVINGTPINDASHMFVNWTQRSTSPAAQGLSNRVLFSQDQGQALRSIGLASQQLDMSLYGMPVASARGSLSQYSYLQGMPHDATNKTTGQVQKPIMQSMAFSSPFVGDQVTSSPEQVCFPQGAFTSKQKFQRNNVSGQVPLPGLNSTIISGNQLGNTLPKNASPTEYNGTQEQAGWPGSLQPKHMQVGLPRGLVPLDPMEEKILYNMDDDIWDASLGRRTDFAGGFGTTLEHTDYSNVFPSTQSGSWSALMQSAVAEASSSDTGLQEEWSGLTFQNTELSTDNQPSNVLDSEKQRSSWLDNNMLSTSCLSSKQFPVLNDSSVSSSFPGFQQPGVQFPVDQRGTQYQDDSHESIHRSPKNTGEWLDCSPKQKPSTEGIQPLVQLDSPWTGQILDHSESDAQQRRIAPCNNVSLPCSKPKGDGNEGTYKVRNSDYYLWGANSNHGVSSFSRSIGGLEQIHSGNSTLSSKEDSQIFNFPAVPNSSPSKACWSSSQQVQHGNQLDYARHVDISRTKEYESLAKNQHQMSNGSHVLHNYQMGAGGTYEMQQTCYQKDDSYDIYGSKEFSGQEQEHLGQLKFIGNVTGSAMNFDKGPLTKFQVNSKGSEVPSRGDIDTSTTLHRSVGPRHMNVTAPTSENMLELLHKVDQSKENCSTPHFGSRGCNSLVPEAETPVSIAQSYSQSAASQGFTLKLAPPSQKLSNMNPFISSQGFPDVASYQNLRQGNSELGEKNPTWLASPSVQSLPPSHDSTQRSNWGNKFSGSGQTSIPSSIYKPVSSVAAFTSSPSYIRNQLGTQEISHTPPASPSLQTSWPGNIGRYPSFNLTSSQQTSPRNSANTSSQQFEVLDVKPVVKPSVMSGIHQQGVFPPRLHNVWTNVPLQQQLSRAEPYKVPPVGPSTDSLESPFASPRLNDQNSQKVGNGLSVFSASMNSQGFEYGADLPKKESSQLQISSEMLDASQTSYLSRNVSDANAFASGSFLAHSHQQDLDGVHEHNNTPERSLGSIDHSLKPSNDVHLNYSLLHQVQAMKNLDANQSMRVSDIEHIAATDGARLLYEQNSRFRNQLDTGMISGTQFDSLSSGDIRRQSLLTEEREDSGMKASPQPALLDRTSQVMVKAGHNDPSQPTSSSLVSNYGEHSQTNAQMARSWFNQYEALRNGQMPPTYDARLPKPAVGKIPFGKPSQNLNEFSLVERIDAADASQSGRDSPSSATFRANETLSDPYLSPLDETGQCLAIIRPKKRKTATSDLLPWHKEIIQDFQRVHSVSVAEHEWAKATNRMIEKPQVEDEIELTEDWLSKLRSKRRLVLTTQLMQQLLRPAPVSFLSAKNASQYDSLIYFVAKLSLGDACSLTSCKRSGLSHIPLINSDLISQKLTSSEGVDGQLFSEVADALGSRARKLEDELPRLDKAASILDLRMECQELEKFSVINRFAKFHVRTSDSAGTSSSSDTTIPAMKPFPQRYVTAHPIPRNLPEGVQCLSL